MVLVVMMVRLLLLTIQGPSFPQLDRTAPVGRSTSTGGGGGGGGTSHSPHHRPLLHRFVIEELDVAAGGGKMGDVVPAITVVSLIQRLVAQIQG